MQPEQPNTGYGPNNQYDFIVNPGSPPKKPLIPKVGGGSFAMKLIFLVGGAVILIILMWIVGNILGGSKVNTADIITLTQMQEEISRVADQGKDATAQNLKNTAMGTKLSAVSQQQAWLEFLGAEGVEVDDKELALKKNDATDAQLEEAKSSSTFDLAFNEIMETYLQDYADTLKTDFAKAADETERTLLSNHYAQVQLLLKEFSAIK
jgi:hypothetical protein